MANSIQISISTITSDRASATISDETTYSSPARAAVGVFVGCYKMNGDSTVADTLTLVSNTDDPETDSEWVMQLDNGDGWYRIPAVSIPDFDDTLTYDIYDAVFDPSSGNVYRSKQNTNTQDSLANTTWWELISDPAALALNEEEANESTNIDSTIYEVILSPNSEYEYANLISEVAEECCKVECSIENLLPYIRVAALVDGMYVHSDRSEMVAGERLARRLESIIEEINR